MNFDIAVLLTIIGTIGTLLGTYYAYKQYYHQKETTQKHDNETIKTIRYEIIDHENELQKEVPKITNTPHMQDKFYTEFIVDVLRNKKPNDDFDFTETSNK